MKSTTQRDQPNMKNLFVSLALLLTISGIIACSDLQPTGISNTDFQQAQTQFTHNHPSDTLLIVLQEDKNLDGTPENREIVPQETLSNLNPKHINSIDVLKGEEAIQKYGQRGAKGVVFITLIDKQIALSDTSTISPAVTSTESTSSDTTHKEYFITVDQMPQPKDDLRPMHRCIRYPDEARKAGIEGRVIVRFIVNELGEVEDPEIIRGIGGGADEEAIRCVQQLAFEPGLQQGEPVRVQYALPIKFSLSDAKGHNLPSKDSVSRTEPPNLGPATTVVGFGGEELNQDIAVGVSDTVNLNNINDRRF